jgi:hypothetical protein
MVSGGYLVGKGFPRLVNSRTNPWSGLTEKSLTEIHRVPYEAPFVLYTNEVPKLDTPSTVKVNGYIEVQFQPNPGEFWVDYKYNTGGIMFNSADSGNVVTVTYKGKGSLVNQEHFNRLASGDPQSGSFNQWWRYAEVGDHFTLPGTVHDRIWRETVNTTVHQSNHWTSCVVTNATSFAYYRSRDEGFAGLGCIIAGRFKIVNTSLADNSVYVGYVPTDRSQPILAFTFEGSPAQMGLALTRTTGAQQSISNIFSPGVAWHSYTLIYSPTPGGTGYLELWIDGYEEFRTTIPTLVATATMAPFYMTAEKVGVTGDFSFDADYVVAVPVCSFVRTAF